MWKFIKHEWSYWLTSPMTWIFLLINTLLIFGAVSSDNISIGGGVGNVYKNAPSVIQNYYGIMSLLCLLMTTAFMNASAIRDFQHGMYQFVFTSPIRKSDYYFGKFFGAFTMAILPLIGVSLGALLGPLMPWADSERFGEVIWSGHILGLLAFGIPNTFIIGVILYALAIIFRSSLVSFIGAMGILVMYSIASGFTSDIEKEWLANLLDPFGFRPSGIIAKYMTVDERNTQAIPLAGGFLFNRLIWITLSFLLLIFSYTRFKFSKGKEKGRKRIKEVNVSNQQTFDYKLFTPSNPGKFNLRSWIYLCLFEIKSVIKNPTFIIIVILGLINLVVNLTSFTNNYGTNQYPVTYDVIDSIQSTFYIFLIAIITFYSGTIVWKERDSRFNEIQDATPVQTGMLFSTKVIGLVSAIGVIQIVNILLGICAQALHGFNEFKIDVYIKTLLLHDQLSFAYLVVAALFFHYIINNRYIAYFAFVTFILLNSFVWGVLEVSSNMVKFGGTPNIIYSDMNGFGPFVTSVTWFHVYWFLANLVLAFIIHAFYIRGKETGFMYRFIKAGKVIKKNSVLGVVLLLLFLICGGFVYYNTKVINTYLTSDEYERRSVDYEKQYKKYLNLPQPRIYKVKYELHLEPYELNMTAKADLWLKNKFNVPIREIHLNIPGGMDSIEINIPGTTLKLRDNRLRYRIYEFNTILNPGDTFTMNVKSYKIKNGFENEVRFTSLTQNGTFLNNMDFIPSIGYSEGMELSNKHKRRKNDLPKKREMPVLNEMDTLSRMNNYVTNDADWVDVETIISTAPDQIAIAPGSLIKKWEENGKAWFHYKIDKPSFNFYSFASARYEVERKKWNGIDLEVYYIKEHAYNVPNMLKSLEKSLEYYTENFGPYFHKQARIIEFPRYSSFAQAFPGTMPYSESIGFIMDLRDVEEDDIDLVYYVVAHEVGHQYWAHQLCGAAMQGSTWMSEGFAQYSSLMVMEKEYGRDKMKKFLKYEMDGYLRARGFEWEAERPMLRVESQSYVYYQKASVVMYYLKEMIGVENVNKAMRSLLNQYAYKEPPYATSLDAYRAFDAVTPDSLKYVLNDLFENITLYNNRVMEAQYIKKGNLYEIEIKTKSEKFRADTLGKETSLPINDYVDIAVFAESSNNLPGKPLVMKRIKLTKTENTFVFTTSEKPAKAGIDPYNYLIDRIPEDNLKTITLK